MQHTDEEVEQAAERFDQLAETLGPETARVVSTDDLEESRSRGRPYARNDRRSQRRGW